jgi:hypothetical protein
MATKKKTSKKKAAKRAGGRPKAGEPTKADFIREKLKAGMSASEVVKAGAEKGMKISPPQVYKLKTKLSGGSSTKPSAPRGKSAARDGKLSASEFVRQHADKKAAEIVELAKAAGIKVTAGLVYTTRAYDKKKGGETAPKGKPGPKPRAKKVQALPSRASNIAAEEQFKQLLAAIGIERARSLIEEAASWGRVFGVMK